jgi:exosome complex exonuclease DIS3/RRP44
VNKKILVAIDAWASTSRYPDGHFVRVLGDVGGEDAEREGLMLEFGISYGAFGSAILGCLPPEGDSWVVPPKSDDHVAWKGREDLRDLTICSIDPPSLSRACLCGPR